MEDKYMEELMQDIQKEQKRNDLAVKALYGSLGVGVGLVSGCVGRGQIMDAIVCGLICGVSALVLWMEA